MFVTYKFVPLHTREEPAWRAALGASVLCCALVVTEMPTDLVKSWQSYKNLNQ